MGLAHEDWKDDFMFQYEDRNAKPTSSDKTKQKHIKLKQQHKLYTVLARSY